MRPLIVISDLHLSHGGRRAPGAALGSLLAAHPGHELVLAGDTFNLSADPPARSPACSASELLLASHAELCAALRGHLAAGDPVTIIAGNHDAGALDPALREELLGRLELRADAPLEIAPWFVRRAGLHIEHGHFYDPDNAPAHPLTPSSSATEPLGVALTRRFLAPNSAFEFAHAYEITPMAGILRAFRVFGPRTPLLIARYFSVAARICAEARRPGRFDSERAAGERALEAFALEAGLEPEVVRALVATGAPPTHESFSRTFMRLYFDRVLASVGMVSASLRGLTWNPAALTVGALAGLYLVASVKRSGNRYRNLPVQRLRHAAARVRELTAAEGVIFGHTHHEDDAPGYWNSGSFGYPRSGRPYLLVREDRRIERRSIEAELPSVRPRRRKRREKRLKAG